MKGGNKMKVNFHLFVAVMFVLAILVSAFAQVSTPSIPVTASIGGQNSINVTINRIVNTTWTTASSIAFGLLSYNSTNRIFTAPAYYALDVNIASNAANWTVTHTANTIGDGLGNNLDSNINVGFVRQTGNTTFTNLTNGYVSYSNSTAKSYTSSALSGGWLRIYYGLGTGSGDYAGVTPITTAKPAGNYTGSVVLTLTSS
jgi:hypothetical protein